MSKAYLSKTIFSQATPILGAAALSAIALLGMPQSAKADNVCGPGDHWVDECKAGVDKFPLSWAYLNLWLMPPNQPMQQQKLLLSGPAKVFRDDPVDTLLGDPDLANMGLDQLLGVQDGHKGVIKTRLEEKFTGSGITLTGKGFGAITEATELGINRPDLASSFFKVFAEIDTPFGKARNMDPVIVYGDRWLRGVPPNKIDGQFPPPALPVPFTARQAAKCSAIDPLAAIIYCGFEKVDFFAIGDDGNFITDPAGEKIKVATLHKEAHVVHKPIPEPSTALASIFAGLTAIFGLTRKQRSK